MLCGGRHPALCSYVGEPPIARVIAESERQLRDHEALVDLVWQHQRQARGNLRRKIKATTGAPLGSCSEQNIQAAQEPRRAGCWFQYNRQAVGPRFAQTARIFQAVFAENSGR